MFLVTTAPDPERLTVRAARTVAPLHGSTSCSPPHAAFRSSTRRPSPSLPRNRSLLRARSISVRAIGRVYSQTLLPHSRSVGPTRLHASPTGQTGRPHRAQSVARCAACRSDPRGFVSVVLPQLPFLVRIFYFEKKAPQRGGEEILLGRDATSPSSSVKGGGGGALHQVHAAPPIRLASAEVSSLASRFSCKGTLMCGTLMCA